MRYTLLILIAIVLVRNQSFAFTFSISINSMPSVISNENKTSNATIKWSGLYLKNPLFIPGMIPLLLFE